METAEARATTTCGEAAAGGAEGEMKLPSLFPNAEYDAELSLADRERKWGFTLEELRGASKVVRTLFHDPTLFIGDPYLGDSRLYTMITRDRQKKREHRDTYKAIMNEEKSRRKKYLRNQNQAALGLTIMKREREEALGTLMLQGRDSADPGHALLLKDHAEVGEEAHQRQADQSANGSVGGAEGQLSSAETAQLRLTGAFENVLRLERCLAGVEHFESALSGSNASAAAQGGAGSQEPVLVTGKATERPSAGPIDWTAASQLTAQVYRFVPHAFGSQMPPPLFAGAVPPNTPENEQRHYIRGFKVFLARQAAEHIPHLSEEEEGAGEAGEVVKRKRQRQEAREEGGCGGVSTSTSSSSSTHCFSSLPAALDELAAAARDETEYEVLVTHHQPPPTTVDEGTTRVSRLRDFFSAPSRGTLFDEVPTGVSCRLAPVQDVLAAVEAVLVQGCGAEATLWAPASSTAASHPSLPAKSGSDLTLVASAESTLNVLLARRLYGNRKLRELGPSPIVVERVPPTSESEEPDAWNAFDEVQLYGTEHYDGDGLKLSNWRGCNICKVRFNRLHPYYYSMCHLCGEFNYNKRLLTRDLRGKVVLLTGCRIKIGFAMALSLLRCGATVLGTTRFAHEAVARFQQEADYEAWQHRLHLYSLDLRDLWVVTQFCAFLQQRFPKLFAIVNNAAQTIARTPQYTEHLRQIELDPAPELQAAIQRDPTADEWNRFFLRHTSVTVGEALSIERPPTAMPFLPIAAGPSDNGGRRGRANAEGRVAVAVLEEDDGEPPTVTSAVTAAAAAVPEKPTGIIDHLARRTTAAAALVFDRYDTQAEESDHRETNSWVMKLGEVQGSEAAEVMAINALAPFIMNSKLKPCLTNRAGDATANEARFIINVSAMEGQFYRFKQTTHPHTNMAKAALNMMTRTSAEDYAEDGIFMNSVDTGWITDESPKHKKERRAEQYLLCPLDEVDAAARCLDLIYTDSTVHGHFYKDFKSIPW